MTKKDCGLIGDVEIRQIVALVEALDRSSFDSLQLDFGHFRLTLGKAGTRTELPSITQAQPKPVSGAPPASGSATAQTSPTAVPPAPGPSARATAKRPRDTAAAGTIDVRSPIMGLFYSNPDPASLPFVSLGTEVHEGTTVGLIEVMKVYNAVQAGAKGVIVEICVENGETVEIGQTLFRIRPTAI